MLIPGNYGNVICLVPCLLMGECLAGATPGNVSKPFPQGRNGKFHFNASTIASTLFFYKIPVYKKLDPAMSKLKILRGLSSKIEETFCIGNKILGNV